MKRVYSTEENLPARKKAKEKDRGNKSVFVQWFVKNVCLQQAILLLATENNFRSDNRHLV